MQVFDTVRRSGMGALYQQFFYWGVRLHRDVKQQAALGDSQAAESAQRLEECLVACQTGTRALGLPMYVSPRERCTRISPRNLQSEVTATRPALPQL